MEVHFNLHHVTETRAGETGIVITIGQFLDAVLIRRNPIFTGTGVGWDRSENPLEHVSPSTSQRANQ